MQYTHITIPAFETCTTGDIQVLHSWEQTA